MPFDEEWLRLAGYVSDHLRLWLLPLSTTARYSG